LAPSAVCFTLSVTLPLTEAVAAFNQSASTAVLAKTKDAMTANFNFMRFSFPLLINERLAGFFPIQAARMIKQMQEQ
jgi:hypothetical protein